jgi:hypothetical protein
MITCSNFRVFILQSGDIKKLLTNSHYNFLFPPKHFPIIYLCRKTRQNLLKIITGQRSCYAIFKNKNWKELGDEEKNTSANELPRSRSQRWPAISFFITSGYCYAPFGGTHMLSISRMECQAGYQKN